MAAPVQKGTTLEQQSAPTFANYIVIASTWRERDSAKTSETENEDSEVINVAFADPGVDATGDIVVKDTFSKLIKGDVITSTETAPRKFLVMDVETSDFGGRVLKQTVTLRYATALNAVLP